MKRQSLATFLAIGITMAAATAGATNGRNDTNTRTYSSRHTSLTKNARARAVPELSTGAMGSAAAVVLGGLMVLGGYRKKRPTQ